MGGTYVGLGMATLQGGDAAGAMAFLQRADGILSAVLAPGHPQIAAAKQAVALAAQAAQRM